MQQNERVTGLTFLWWFKPYFQILWNFNGNFLSEYSDEPQHVESITKHVSVAPLFNHPHDADLIKAKEKLRVDNQKLNQF